MQSTDRTASILNSLKGLPEGIGIIELSRITAIPPSSLHRALKALLQHGLVWQSPATRKYFLGMGLLDLSSLLLEFTQPSLRQRSLPLMSQLSERTRATVFLAVLAQDQIISTNSIYPSADTIPQISVLFGQSMPVHCAATAKAILAHQTVDIRDRLISHCDFKAYTKETIRSSQQLLDHLEAVRSRGFAMCAEEAEEGITAIAAPAFDSEGSAIASIGLCGPTSRLKGNKFSTIVRELLGIARSLTVN